MSSFFNFTKNMIMERYLKTLQRVIVYFHFHYIPLLIFALADVFIKLYDGLVSLSLS